MYVTVFVFRSGLCLFVCMSYILDCSMHFQSDDGKVKVSEYVTQVE